MPSANVIVPPEVKELIAERERVWVDFERSLGLAEDLKQLSNQIPDCAPAQLQLSFGAGSTPPAELETVLSMAKQEIGSINKLKAEVQGCYGEIERIKQKQRTVVLFLIIGGVVAFLLVLIVLISIVSQLSS